MGADSADEAMFAQGTDEVARRVVDERRYDPVLGHGAMQAGPALSLEQIVGQFTTGDSSVIPTSPCLVTFRLRGCREGGTAYTGLSFAGVVQLGSIRSRDLPQPPHPPKNDPVRAVHRDQAVMLELRDFAGNGLDREAQVDLQWGDHADPGALRHVEKEGGDAFVGARAAEANDLILRHPHLAADLSVELRPQIRIGLNEVGKTMARKSPEADWRHRLSRERVSVDG
jgi:hypothetical protein